MTKNKEVFLEGRLFFSANQSFLKAFEIALIGWIKDGSTKRRTSLTNMQTG